MTATPLARSAHKSSSAIRCLKVLVAISGLVCAPELFADWNTFPEIIDGHDTWIYTPKHQMASGSNGLMVVLHGCAQTSRDLKEFGNLTKAADVGGMVLAVPYVSAGDATGLGCWEYDVRRQKRGHIPEIIGLTRTLADRESLKIDKNQIYVVGLSSGAGLSLALACVAPDLFVGVGAIAGPTVGSLQEPKVIFANRKKMSAHNVTTAVEQCSLLAGEKRYLLETQVANVAFGDMDKNGAKAVYEPPSSAFYDPHQGQYRVVSIFWSKDNAQAFRQLYQTGELSAPIKVQNGMGTERQASSMKDNQLRLSLLEIHNVGHAWPAGDGSAGYGGQWIAPAGFDYPTYIINWLKTNNTRAKYEQ